MNVVVKSWKHPEQSPQSVASILFRSLGVEGVYARTDLFERVIEKVTAFISSERDPKAEVLRFPPVMSRTQLEKSGYLSSFPHLLGCVCCLEGTEGQIRGAVERVGENDEWTGSLKAANLVLTPAACYPVYPLAAQRGDVPEDGLLFDVAADCFRHEPSNDLDRLQSFRMREFVRIGTPDQIKAFRNNWMTRARGIANRLGLVCTIENANDPFFGRGGQIMAASQVQRSLKFELLVPVLSMEKLTACMSFNYHCDHFGEVWGLKDAAGNIAHTGCVAFGLDRLGVALFRTHGLDLEDWPSRVRESLDI